MFKQFFSQVFEILVVGGRPKTLSGGAFLKKPNFWGGASKKRPPNKITPEYGGVKIFKNGLWGITIWHTGVCAFKNKNNSYYLKFISGRKMFLYKRVYWKDVIVFCFFFFDILY